MSKFVQFGAGNIGRSFIGRLFAEAGFEVVFVDVDQELIHRLNSAKKYRVAIKGNDSPDEIRIIENIRAIDGKDADRVIGELSDADFCATSVGSRAFASLFPLIARAIEQRYKHRARPLDLILAENVRDAAKAFRQGIGACLAPGFPLEASLGLVETSIGKMVPIMRREYLLEDPLLLFAEPYDTLIVDRKAFKNKIPPLRGLEAVGNIRAYVDRKLFMHNMSHAASAYLGYQEAPELTKIWQVMELPKVVAWVRSAIVESAEALQAMYPEDFSLEGLLFHGEDLLKRYANRALGDTLYRVGRDLKRKLDREDRLIGACLLAARQGLTFKHIAMATAAAFSFKACDATGSRLDSDLEFLAESGGLSLESALKKFSRLDSRQAEDKLVIDTIVNSARSLSAS